jgi:serine phosphatase RsbU (regulator of sigma subunit)
MLHTLGIAQSPPIIQLTNENVGNSFADFSVYYQTGLDTLSADEVLQFDEEKFLKIEQPIADFNFTKDVFWVKFSVTNESTFDEFYLEFARPITNEVQLFYLDHNQIIDQANSGDDYSYYQKPIQHRKNLFPLALEKGDTTSFLLKMKSDGEVLLFPLRIYDKNNFHSEDFKVQFTNGFYYGLIILVFVIYFFFYLFLKDKSYLFYILYVLSQGLLQFSLDGYAHHHFFSKGGYLTNHSLLFFAGITIIFLLAYVENFLALRKQNPNLYRVYLGTGIVVCFVIVLSLIPGAPYQIAFPLINGISLISILLPVFTILYLRAKGVKVDIFFTVAFFALISGAIIFILGNFNVIENKSITLNALKMSSAFEFVILSISMSNKYGQLQQEKNEAQAIALQNLREKNALMDEVNINLEKQVQERTKQIADQKEKIEESNKEIVSSIKYAKRIQEAILPSNEQVKALIEDSFIYYLPKDVVSGDFYFVEQVKTSGEMAVGYTLIAAVDCTGHGVPGAFLSIVANNLLAQSILERDVNTPAEALNFINQGLSKTLRQQEHDATVRDGMDIALCALSNDRSHLMFAGAKNPLYLVRKKSENQPTLPEACMLKEESNDACLYEIKGDAHPIGNYFDSPLKNYTNHKIELLPGDAIYLFSDGFADQFGGPKGKKFRYKPFRELLLSIHDLSMEEQEDRIKITLNDWKGDYWQLDDILVIGFTV